MTVIIIEGPDLSGKTFAIEKIAKKLNSGFVLKNSFKPKTVEDSCSLYAHYLDILTLVTNRKDIVILDRFYPSQAVYSYKRGKDEMHSSEIKAIDIVCKREGVLYIYLDTTLDILEHRYRERGDEHITIEELKKIKERYDEFYLQTSLTKTKLNTLELDWLEKIVGWINEY